MTPQFGQVITPQFGQVITPQFGQAVAQLHAPAANIIFIEKRISCPASLENATAFSDLSVGYTMFFSRRWMICCRLNELRDVPVFSQVPGPAANIIFIEKLISLAPHKQIFAHLMDTALHEELHRS